MKEGAEKEIYLPGAMKINFHFDSSIFCFDRVSKIAEENLRQVTSLYFNATEAILGIQWCDGEPKDRDLDQLGEKLDNIINNHLNDFIETNHLNK